MTRGMLVVDRREDVGAYAPGVNRAEVQAELERHHFKHTGTYESTAVPAQVEVEAPPTNPGKPQEQGPATMQDSKSKTHTEGVPCITETPGPAALLQLLLERVWGVEYDKLFSPTRSEGPF